MLGFPLARNFSARHCAGLILSLALATASTSAVSEVLFSTSFESPEYLTGTLDGQDVWDVGFFDSPVITSSFARTGEQSVVVIGSALVDFTGSLVTTLPKIKIKQSVYFTGADPFSANFVSPIAAIGDGGFIGQLSIRNGGASLGGGASATGFVPVSTGEWIDLELVLDFASQTQEAFVNGMFVGSGEFAGPSTQLAGLQLFILNDRFFNGTIGPFDPVYLDDLTITAVPVPAAVWFLLSGMAGLVVSRRRLRPNGLSALN